MVYKQQKYQLASYSMRKLCEALIHEFNARLIQVKIAVVNPVKVCIIVVIG